MSQTIPAPQTKNPAEPAATRLRKDTAAGLINATVSVPDGLASASLAGVDPVYGLYTSIAGPIAGSLLVSAQLMQIATTSASALIAGRAISRLPPEERNEALFLLVVLAGSFLTLFGFLRLGRLVRFVSHAVMTGFLIGVAVVLVLDQLAPLIGVEPKGGSETAQFFHLLRSIPRFDGATLFTGLLTLAIVIGLRRTRIASFGSIFALVVPSLFVALLGWETVQRVADIKTIPPGLPIPTLPNLRLITPGLVFSAFALAVVIGVQGAGVSQSVENPDQSRISVSRDLVAQGVANVASGCFSGIPAGGSVGQTALNVSVGARSRWSGIMGGIWMLIFVLLAHKLVGMVPMAALAALMILAGFSAIDLREARSIWNTGGSARWAIAVTFVATLIFPVPLAVAAGVMLTVVLYVSSSASDVTVRALIRTADGRFSEGDPPARLPGRAVTVLEVYGSLFFAGARTLMDALPKIGAASHPVVVLRLRGRSRVGATLVEVLDSYADDLAEVGGRLYLSGVDEDVSRQLRQVGKLDLDKTVQLVPETNVLGASTEQALASASAWLGSKAVS